MKRFLFGIFLFSISSSLFSQQGWWTWMNGTSNPAAPASFGVQGVPAAANLPPAMYKTDACWTDSQGKLWFYGGDSNSSALWKYDPTTNMWTWMKGPSAFGLPAVYGTKGVAAPANNPPVVTTGSALAWIDASDNLWLWGGALGGSLDMWKYNPLTNMWTWVHGPGGASGGSYGTLGVSSPTNLPPGRYETSAAWVDNAGNFWMFGGGVALGQINDMWKYNPAINEWTWMKGPNVAGNAGSYGTKGVAAPTNNPPCRWPYCRWTDNAGNFWLFGGTGVNNNTDSYNDLWKFDPATNNWTWISGTNLTNQMPAFPPKCVPSVTAYPQGRYENAVAWKDKCDNLWMFSGQWTAAQGSPSNSDVWCYKPATNEWVFVGGNVITSTGVKGVPAASNFPGQTYGASSFSYNNQFWMFGGRGGSNGNNMWRYEPDSACAQSFCSPQSPDPTANFNGSNLIGCAPLTVTFTNTSTNSTQWTWNFGDGTTGNTQHPVHTYTAAGTYSVSLISSNGILSDTMTFLNYVIVIPMAVISTSILPNDTVCLGTTVTFVNSTINATSYSWAIPGVIKGDTSQNFIYTFPTVGTHTVILTASNAFGCNDQDTFNIVVLNGFASTQSVSICSGSAYTLPGGTVVSTAGTYVDTIGTGLCDSIITTQLTLTLPFLSTQSLTACQGDSVQLPGGNYVSIPGTYIDSLSTSGGCDSIIITVLATGTSVTSTQNAIICTGNSFVLPGGQSVSVAGTYIDTIPSSGGCDSIITTNLTVNNSSSSIQNPIACAGTPFILPGGTTVTVSGTYSDTLTAANGCDSIITTNLTVNALPNVSVSPNVTITLGSTTTLSATGGGTYSWSPSAGLNNTTGSSVICDPVQNSVYCVIVTNSSGCTDSACVNVSVEIVCGEFYIPNAFSPNGDNENDVFKAYIHPLCVTDFKLTIYNRWGEKIFETTDVTNGWNGEFRGTISNPGVYAFFCKATFTNGKHIMKEGNVSLVR